MGSEKNELTQKLKRARDVFNNVENETANYKRQLEEANKKFDSVFGFEMD